MQVSKPLIRIDAGWFYAVAGIVLCACGILVPVQKDLHDLEFQLLAIREKEHLATQQLKVSSDLLDRLEAGDANLIRRLAASQLNLLPGDRIPLLRSTAPTETVTDWVDATISDAQFTVPVHRRTMLGRLTDGNGRLWLFGAGVMCVFIGMLLDPALSAISRKRSLRISRRKPRDAVVRQVMEETVRAVDTLPGVEAHDDVAVDDPDDRIEEEAATEVTSSFETSWEDIGLDDEIVEVEDDGERPDSVADDQEKGEIIPEIEVASDIMEKDFIEVTEETSETEPLAVVEDPSDQEAVATDACVTEDETECEDDSEEEADEEWEYVEEEAEDESETVSEEDAEGDTDSDDEYEYEYVYVYVDEDGNEIETDEEPEIEQGAI